MWEADAGDLEDGRPPSGVQVQSPWWGFEDKAAKNGVLWWSLTYFDYLTVDLVFNLARFIKGDKIKIMNSGGTIAPITTPMDPPLFLNRSSQLLRSVSKHRWRQPTPRTNPLVMEISATLLDRCCYIRR